MTTEIEQAVLGSFLLSDLGERSDFFISQIREEDFGHAEHREIFAAIKSELEAGRVPTFRTLAPRLSEMRIGDMTGVAYLGRLVSVGMTAHLLPGYIHAMKQSSGRRMLSAARDSIEMALASEAADVKASTESVMCMLEDVLSSLRTNAKSSFDVGHIAAENIKELKSGKKPNAIKTGLLDLDRVLGGWHRGELAIIGGRPSMGKSAFLFSSLRQAAKGGTCSLIFSLEMRRKTAVNRMLSDAVWNSTAPINYDRIERYDLQQHEIERIEQAAEKFASLPIRIDDQAGLSVAEISSRSRKYADEMAKLGKRIDVIAIDHLGKVAASSRYAGNKVHETGEKVNSLFNLGRELNVSMVVATQLNRGTEKRENKRAEMSDNRDSGDIEQDADTMLFPYRRAYYLQSQKEDDREKEDKRKELLDACKNLIEIGVAKNRNGPRPTLEFFCDMGSNVIRDIVK